jgi:iron-sulfur cluster assembly protein
MTVTLTEKAEFRLRAFLASSATDANGNTKGIRISVKDGGCNGYEYGMDITSKANPDDLVIEQGKVTLYVDAQSAPLLEGVVIDFVDGVMDSGFKFTNPNATDTCGCGKSFKTSDCNSPGVPCT